MLKSRTNISVAKGVRNINHALAREAVDKLQNYYLPWISEAIDALDDWDLWQRPHPGVSSVANLMLHLEGNVRQWIHHGLRGDEDARDRDSEFRATEGYTKLALMIHLRKTVNEACGIIEEYTEPGELLREKTIQGFKSSAYNAIFHVVEHFAYHTGQIVYLAKVYSERDFGFYEL